jgi:hypothetical protein
MLFAVRPWLLLASFVRVLAANFFCATSVGTVSGPASGTPGSVTGRCMYSFLERTVYRPGPIGRAFHPDAINRRLGFRVGRGIVLEY